MKNIDTFAQEIVNKMLSDRLDAIEAFLMEQFPSHKQRLHELFMEAALADLGAKAASPLGKAKGQPEKSAPSFGEAKGQPTYRIKRFHSTKENEIIAHGLTLKEAQEHCTNPDTCGDSWFDGYEEE